MAKHEDKFYDVDPGMGSKKDGCPYSFFKDGQDVIEFIIPPEGYIFKRFRFEPYDDDPFYEGKIVAEYEVGEIKEEPLLKPYMWVIVGIAAIAFMLFAAYCTKRIVKKIRKKARMTVVDHTVKDTSTIDTAKTDTISFMSNPSSSGIQEKTGKFKDIEKEKTRVKFQESFWTLVHQGTATMDDFHDLYVKYKKRVKCEEYEYLRLVILQNYATFKKWNKLLLQIPPDELQAINDITTLQKKIDINN